MQEKKNFFSRLLRSYRGLPAKKQYVEFFTAILTVPVLLTVIILNVSNLRQEEAKKTTPEPTPRIIITVPDSSTETKTTGKTDTAINTTPAEACKKEIGPVDIASPIEGETITVNPLIISIDREGEGYCAVVWSYRINAGRWSDYDDKSIALYNPPVGQITLDLRVKSVVTGQEKLLSRKFRYEGSDQAASSSGTISN